MPEVDYKKAIVIINLADHRCPACGSTDRWEGMEPEEYPGNNPAIIVWCGCGRGELWIEVA